MCVVCVCVHLGNKQQLFTTCSRSSSLLFTVQAFHRNLFVAASAASHAIRNSTLVKPQVKLCGRQHFPVAVKAMPQLQAGSPGTPTPCAPFNAKSSWQLVQLCWFYGQPVAWARGHAGRTDWGPQLDHKLQEKLNHVFKSKMWSRAKLQVQAHIKIATVGSYLRCSMRKGQGLQSCHQSHAAAELDLVASRHYPLATSCFRCICQQGE